MDYGREELGFKRILAITSPDNESSIRLLGKLGFKFEGLETLYGETQPIRLFSSDV